MSKELLFIGEPLEFKQGVKIYPPKVKDIVACKHYSIYSHLLTQSQEEIEDIYIKEDKDITSFPTPLEFMFNNCYNSKEYEMLTKKAFAFFLKEEVDFLYDQKVIIIGSLKEILKTVTDINEIIMITEDEFFAFQNLIRLATNQKKIETPNPNEHPKIKAMKAKARYRDKVKAKQNAKNGITLFTTMTSICCMGLGITPLNIGEMSYVAMEAILSQYQTKEKYQIDINSLLAGADSKKIKPVYWIRNLEDN